MRKSTPGIIIDVSRAKDEFIATIHQLRKFIADSLACKKKTFTAFSTVFLSISVSPRHGSIREVYGPTDIEKIEVNQTTQLKRQTEERIRTMSFECA